MKRMMMLGLLVVLALTLAACSAEIERNPDGSLTITTTITEEILSEELALALSESQFEEMAVDLDAGAAFVSGVRINDAGHEDTVSFRLDLGAADGHVTAEVSEVQVNGEAPPADRVARWATRIEDHLERIGTRGEHSSVEAVTIDGDNLVMEWRRETRRSQASE